MSASTRSSGPVVTSRRTLGFAVLLGLALTQLGCPGETEGNGKAGSEIRSGTDFTRVECLTDLDIAIEQGDEFHIELRVDENLVPLVTTRVEDGTLVINSKGSIDPHLAGPHLIVTMPAIERAELSGSGRIDVDGFDSDRPLELALTGSGKMSFSGKAAKVKVDLSGSGRVDLAGVADRADVDLSGSGRIEGKDLMTSGAAADLSGSGLVFLSVDGPVDIDLSGSGNIELYGDPVVSRKSISGSGEVKVH